jgi:hypothetical protein
MIEAPLPRERLRALECPVAHALRLFAIFKDLREGVGHCDDVIPINQEPSHSIYDRIAGSRMKPTERGQARHGGLEVHDPEAFHVAVDRSHGQRKAPRSGVRTLYVGVRKNAMEDNTISKAMFANQVLELCAIRAVADDFVSNGGKARSQGRESEYDTVETFTLDQPTYRKYGRFERPRRCDRYNVDSRRNDGYTSGNPSSRKKIFGEPAIC